MKLSHTVFVLAGVMSFAGPALAESTVFESKDILTSSEALGRYQWMRKCYPGLLVEFADFIIDPTTPRSGDEKMDMLQDILLYENGQLKSDAKYITFGNEEGENPNNWYAGTKQTDDCRTIPSDYVISALMVSSKVPQYCAAVSRDNSYEYIKNVKISNVNNESTSTAYSNFIGQAAQIFKDTQYQLELTPGFTPETDSYPETWHVFIDWNGDGDFKDASETYYAGTSATTITLPLTPPANAKKGMTKVRVTMDFLGGDSDACKDIQSGEIEDYLFYIK